ncbi:MAG: DMT family transporter [Deltaproteobacteria bacterium]|nr:DMT family transporter [Deltaproteobacteria bacterium]
MPRPITSGVLLAIASAVAFGLTTPVVAWAGADAGPLTIAALLYGGAAAAAFAMRLVRRSVGGSLKRSDTGRIVAIAISGAAIAPACLAWGLSRAGATGGSLILNFEAVLTVGLAWLIYRESLGRRVIAAMVIMAAGGVLLVLDASLGSSPQPWGIAAVVVATLAWSIDNTLTRPLAERDPLQVIAAKGALGATLTGSIAIVRGEVTPQLATIAILLVCGATGYGLSLRMYLLAQRRIGAARTGSVFALAPFIGAGIAWILGDRDATILTAIAAVGFGFGVYLHASEQHGHAHVHGPTEHEHPHRHDDGHHDHEHDPPFIGEHTHRHAHGRRAHSHEHAPDVHHDHSH